MDWVPLNFAIMRHPANWIIVFLMVYIAVFAFDVAKEFAAQTATQAAA